MAPDGLCVGADGAPTSGGFYFTLKGARSLRRSARGRWRFDAGGGAFREGVEVLHAGVAPDAGFVFLGAEKGRGVLVKRGEEGLILSARVAYAARSRRR